MSAEDLKDIAVTQFKQAKDAAANGDHRNAVALFRQTLHISPESAQIRRALRDSQCEMVPEGAIPKLKSLKLLKLKAQMKVVEAAGNWDSLLSLAEEAAEIAPRDAEVSAMTGAAALGLEYRVAAFVFYERAAELAPDNVRYRRKCATLLEQNGQTARAIEFWREVNELDPEDAVARKKIKRLTATGFMETDQSVKREPVPRLPPVQRADDIPAADLEHKEWMTPIEEVRDLMASQPQTAPTPQPTSNREPASPPPEPAPEPEAPAPAPLPPTARPSAAGRAVAARPGNNSGGLTIPIPDDLPADVRRLMGDANGLLQRGRRGEAKMVLGKAPKMSGGDERIEAVLTLLKPRRK